MNRQKAVGTRAETAVVGYLQTNGHPDVERRVLYGRDDRGDLTGLRGWTVEVKAGAKPEYGAWLTEADVERANSGTSYAAVVHKPRNIADPAKYRVVMTLETFARLTIGDGNG